MLDFFDTKHFSAACLGLVALGTFHIADMSDWRIIVLPVALMIGYYFMFREKAN
jgi:hypothetical protein